MRKNRDKQTRLKILSTATSHLTIMGAHHRPAEHIECTVLKMNSAGCGVQPVIPTPWETKAARLRGSGLPELQILKPQPRKLSKTLSKTLTALCLNAGGGSISGKL